MGVGGRGGPLRSQIVKVGHSEIELLRSRFGLPLAVFLRSALILLILSKNLLMLILPCLAGDAFS